MKNIHDMIKEEVLALTNEEIEKMIDYRCAEEGIPLLPPKPVKPEGINISGKIDTTVWELGGLYFTHDNEAKAVRELLEACTLVDVGYISGPRYEMKISGTYDIPQINTKRVFSEKQWEKVKEEVAEADKLDRAYHDGMAVYEKAYNGRKGIRDEIIDVVDAHQKEQNLIDRMTLEFSRYLEIAEGDAHVARRFFEKAYPDVLGRYPIIAGDNVSECPAESE